MSGERRAVFPLLPPPLACTLCRVAEGVSATPLLTSRAFTVFAEVWGGEVPLWRGELLANHTSWKEPERPAAHPEQLGEGRGADGGLCSREVLRATVCHTDVYRLPVVPRMTDVSIVSRGGTWRVFTLVSVSLVPLTVSSLPLSTGLGDICFSRRGGPFGFNTVPTI